MGYENRKCTEKRLDFQQWGHNYPGSDQLTKRIGNALNAIMEGGKNEVGNLMKMIE
jgi:hypothetical protein